MGNASLIVQAHRFHDELALTACDDSEGATVYLSLKQAQDLRRSLGRIIRSIERERFSQAPRGLSFTAKVRDYRTTKATRIEREGE